MNFDEVKKKNSDKRKNNEINVKSQNVKYVLE